MLKICANQIIKGLWPNRAHEEILKTKKSSFAKSVRTLVNPQSATVLTSIARACYSNGVRMLPNPRCYCLYIECERYTNIVCTLIIYRTPLIFVAYARHVRPCARFVQSVCTLFAYAVTCANQKSCMCAR